MNDFTFCIFTAAKKRDLEAGDGASEGDRQWPAVGGSRGKVEVEVAAGTSPPGRVVEAELGAAAGGW